MLHEQEELKRKLLMCTNNDTDSGGGSGGGGGGGFGCGGKKVKAQKVPQRGPGVAELEKILRQQQKEKDDDEDIMVIEGFSSVFPVSHSSVLFPPPLPPPPPPPPLTTSNSLSRSPKNLQLIQKPYLIHNNNNNSTKSHGGYGGGGRGGDSLSPYGCSAVSLPRNGCFPATWSLNGEGLKSDYEIPNLVQLVEESNPIRPLTHPPIQGNCYDYPPPMGTQVNHDPSSALPSPSVFPAGLNHHHLERPSNQRSYTNSRSMWPDEGKMVGMKRPLPFCEDHPAGPSSSLHYRVPPFFLNTNEPDQSSSRSNYSISESEPITTASRNTKRRGQSELSSKTLINQNGEIDGNILTLGPPRSPSPSKQILEVGSSKLELSLQNRSIEDAFQESEQSGSINEKPFYSFLQLKGHRDNGETIFELDKGKNGGEQAIDLNLKL